MIAALLPSLIISPGLGLYFERDSQVAIVPYQKAMDLPEVTVEAWVKFEPNDRFYSYIVSRNYADLGYGIAIHGHPKVFSQAEKTPVPIGKWTHIALAESKRSGKFYVDGNLAMAGDRKGALKAFGHALMIGNSDFVGSPGNEPTGFRGTIDEVRIWSKPKTQAEIRKTMNRYLTGRERNLLAYFPFEEGDVQTIRDYAGHLKPGTLGRTPDPDTDDPIRSVGVQLKGRLPHPRH